MQGLEYSPIDSSFQNPVHNAVFGASSDLLDIGTAKVAIIDDESINVRLISRQLERIGYRFLLGLSDPEIAIDALEDFCPDVVLMDVVMPKVTGIQLLQQMRQHRQFTTTPVIVLTASRDRDTRLQILSLGVSDFLGKPMDEAELSTRLRNVLEAKRYRDSLANAARQLELAVRERTRDLEESRREVLLCLARAAEYRDDNTGRHAARVGRYAGVLARALGQPDDFVEMLELAAQLHDLGKIGIPDAVLHKPGRLTDAEMDVMRRHSEYGWRIVAPKAQAYPTCCHTSFLASLGTLRSPLLVMAAKIAASHHERWDGTGYPNQLAGEGIPLEARLTAVGDVFDALSTPRCYKPAFPLQQCFDIIADSRGTHFDPQAADACLQSRPEFEKIYREMADSTCV